jgi:hypothetical protein
MMNGFLSFPLFRSLIRDEFGLGLAYFISKSDATKTVILSEIFGLYIV